MIDQQIVVVANQPRQHSTRWLLKKQINLVIKPMSSQSGSSRCLKPNAQQTPNWPGKLNKKGLTAAQLVMATIQRNSNSTKSTANNHFKNIQPNANLRMLQLKMGNSPQVKREKAISNQTHNKR